MELGSPPPPSFETPRQGRLSLHGETRPLRLRQAESGQAPTARRQPLLYALDRIARQLELVDHGRRARDASRLERLQAQRPIAALKKQLQQPLLTLLVNPASHPEEGTTKLGNTSGA